MMRRAWQRALLLLYLPLWTFIFLPVAGFGLLGGRGGFFDFKVVQWSWGMWLFAALLILPPIAFAWALSSALLDFITTRKQNAQG